jgi:hypothetical protein
MAKYNDLMNSGQCSFDNLLFQYAMKEKMTVVDASTFLYALFAVSFLRTYIILEHNLICG